jgi:hypothetical protein
MRGRGAPSRCVLHFPFRARRAKDERAALEGMLSKGRISALTLQRARILLAADDGMTDAEIADHLDTARRTVENVRKRCVLEGLEAVVDRKKQDRPSRPSGVRRSTSGASSVGSPTRIPTPNESCSSWTISARTPSRRSTRPSSPTRHDASRKFEIHYTPKHGSWLNVAEIQLSVLAR